MPPGDVGSCCRRGSAAGRGVDANTTPDFCTSPVTIGGGVNTESSTAPGRPRRLISRAVPGSTCTVILTFSGPVEPLGRPPVPGAGPRFLGALIREWGEGESISVGSGAHARRRLPSCGPEHALNVMVVHFATTPEWRSYGLWKPHKRNHAPASLVSVP